MGGGPRSLCQTAGQAAPRITIATLDLLVSPDLPRSMKARRVSVAGLLDLIGAFELAGLLEGDPLNIAQPPWTAYSVVYVFLQIHEKPVTRKSDGKEFKRRLQEAEIRREKRRPRVLEIGLREGDSPCKDRIQLLHSFFVPINMIVSKCYI